MKAISVKQPWASLIISGIKDIENRKWKTNYRGRVLIHASNSTDLDNLPLDSIFTPDTETQEYIDFYLKEGIDFTYWSDRCNWVRTKTIISYFEKEGLLN